MDHIVAASPDVDIGENYGFFAAGGYRGSTRTAGLLAVRTGIADTPRVVGVTLLMALIYLGIGAAVGAVVRSEVNGSLLVVFVWMFDVFFGPAMGGSGAILRVVP